MAFAIAKLIKVKAVVLSPKDKAAFSLLPAALKDIPKEDSRRRKTVMNIHIMITVNNINEANDFSTLPNL